MNIAILAKRLQKATVDNSPTILSGIAIGGTLATAYLTGAATFKAARVLDEAEHNRTTLHEVVPRPLEMKDKVKLTWKFYVPAGLMAFGTITAIVGANRVSTGRAAAMAVAYSAVEKAYSEYRDKVVETIGETKESDVRDRLAQDRVNRTPATGEQLLLNDHQVLFFEPFTGRYFKSDMETVKAGMNTINYRMISDMYATLSEFYEEIGLMPTSMSSEIGWSVDHPMDIHFRTTMAEDGRTPCIVIDYHVMPTTIRGIGLNYPGVH